MDLIPQPPAILIVDDDPDILALLHLIIQNLVPTYDIIPMRDAHSALRHLAQRTVPLLITDYMMPGMDGLQLTAAVKAASPMTHVILATAYGSAALEQRAREQHVDTFLSKTAVFDRLEDVVWSVLHPVAAQKC
jgi:DNA-binding NtrC family response regulator